MLLNSYTGICVEDLNVVRINGFRMTVLKKGVSYELTDRGHMIDVKTGVGLFSFEKGTFPSSHVLVLN